MANPTRHLINIDDSELDQEVHRFISFESLSEILLFGKLTLPKISCWDDPYENFLFKTHVTKNTPSITQMTNFGKSLEEIATRLYGQCWTLIPESDALWRIYSKDNRGVKISTTLRKLYDVINLSESENDSVCLGKVNYLPLSGIESSIKSLKYFTEFNAEYFFNSMLIKRSEFLHEHEVRVIYAAGVNFGKDFKEYGIVINDFINSITLDPRIMSRYETLYRALIKHMGFINDIRKSTLYEFNRLSIEVR